MGVTSEIYLLERVLRVGAAMVTSARAKPGPANESVQVAVVGSLWGFGDKTDGTVIDCIQFVDWHSILLVRGGFGQGRLSL